MFLSHQSEVVDVIYNTGLLKTKFWVSEDKTVWVGLGMGSLYPSEPVQCSDETGEGQSGNEVS